MPDASKPCAAPVPSCDPRVSDCSTYANKLPPVTPSVAPDPSGLAATSALDASERRSFEHLLGHALRETPAVAWATREFASRIQRFLVGGAALNGTTANEALAAAFISSDCDASNTGYVGPYLPAIRTALGSGNIRETWGLMYVLTKTRYFTSLLLALLSPPSTSPPTPPLATPASLASAFGMDAAAVSARWALVDATRSLPSSELQYSQGMPNFEWESFDSWVHFDFDSATHDGKLQWKGARVPRPTGCASLGLLSDDPSIEPPLSAAEIAYQCGTAAGSAENADSDPPAAATAAARAADPLRRCMLQWKPGALCFDLPNASWVLPHTGERVPGLNERAALLGYRSAAAASGTTANMLQMATYLGFRGDELVLLRATMAAWMLPTDDHSFLEILLGAHHYVPHEPFRLVMGLHDLGRLWPPNATLRTSDGKHEFSGADVWQAVGRRLRQPAGQRLLQRMEPPAQDYLRGLVAAAEGRAPRPALSVAIPIEQPQPDAVRHNLVDAEDAAGCDS